MDPRLLQHYHRELQHVREMGAEFAREYPKIAGRLGLEGLECADPYVERLLEGFAFLAGRVQLQLAAEFPRFTQHLLEIVYPHYLAPTPSMAVVQFEPDPSEGALAAGFPLPRQTVLRSSLGRGEQTPCEYRTAHDLQLWPLELTEAEYFTQTRDLAAIRLSDPRRIKAGIRLRLRATAGLSFDKIALDRLPLYLRGADDLPMRLYEQLLGNAAAVVLRPAGAQPAWHEVLGPQAVRRLGFEESQALLPYGSRSFQGYRLLHEYFAFPARFLFVELAGLAPAVRRCSGTELEILVLFERADPALVNLVDPSHFALFCAPAINLFPRRADRIHIEERANEFQVVPDRTRPLDFEVYGITEVLGFGEGPEEKRPFLPFYAAHDRTAGEEPAFYTVHREPRQLSAKQRRVGPRSSYVGSELFLALVDAREAPFRHDLRQLAVATLCTNRDLPLHMPVGSGPTDFTLESSAPVQAARCLAGPTAPRQAWAEGETAWRLISHLSLNYLSLTDLDEPEGAASMRELLGLYGDVSDPSIVKQIEGLRSVHSRPVTRRLPTPGPVAFGRGLEVSVTCDEAAFEGTGVFLLGALLDEFFAQYVSLNSFTETVVKTTQRGEVIRWPVRAGRRLTL